MTDPALASYLEPRLDVEITAIDVLHEGLNTMLAITTESGDRYTLRTPEKLRDSPAFNDLHTEYEILDRLAETQVPTPDPVTYEPDPPVGDDPFLVATYREGTTVPMGTDLPPEYQSPPHRERFAHEYIDTLATIHTLDTTAFEPWCDQRTPVDQLRIAQHRLETSTTVTGRTYPHLETVIDWLLTHAPPTSPTRFLHGDYRPGNILFTDTTPTVAGVIDWEAAFLGDPRTELGYVSLLWGSDTDPRPAPDTIPHADDVIERYAANGFQPYTLRAGSPDRTTIHDRYTEQTGVPFENPRYFQAHAAVLLASVWEDLDRHDHLADDDPTRGQTVSYLAHLAAGIVEAAPTPVWS